MEKIAGIVVGDGEVRTSWSRYASFLRRPPELTVNWTDPVTGARGALVINSSRGGAAGGGTRMRLGLKVREVTYLAKAMELKFALSGPQIGGAKAGIDFDPQDERKASVLERFYAAIAPWLRERYGTGGDLGVDEALDVIPACERVGVRHPQEGVVRGHYRPDADGYAALMQRLETGVVAPVTGGLGVAGLDFRVSDLVTGYGVAEAIRWLLERRGRGIEGARVLLEGFGNVGAACALYLARSGARVVAIRDARQVLVEATGLGAADVEDLIRRRQGKLLPGDDPRLTNKADAFWQPADVFVCAALSETVQPSTLDRLATLGVTVIACGANQPYRELKLGSTRVAEAADARFAVLADILANCGMARALSYLMSPEGQAAADACFDAVAVTIRDALAEVVDRAGGADTGLHAATLGLALDRIEAG